MKANLISRIQEGLPGHTTKAQAEQALAAVVAAIRKETVADGRLTIVGFGTFKMSHRKATIGRNPQTGDSLEIPARSYITFKQSRGG